MGTRGWLWGQFGDTGGWRGGLRDSLGNKGRHEGTFGDRGVAQRDNSGTRQWQKHNFILAYPPLPPGDVTNEGGAIWGGGDPWGGRFFGGGYK